tara:strand:+ start:1070 stop:2161 length:1092 start_codon:yes stop_codon:yes gene_type:complete
MDFMLNLDLMKRRLLPYCKLTIATPIVVMALFILMMVVWTQSGFNNGVPLIYLLSSYLIWGFLLPFIQGVVVYSAFDAKGITRILVNAAILILIHFSLSNFIYYTSLYFLIDPFEMPTLGLLKEIWGPSLLSRVVDFILFFGLLSWVQRSKDLNEKEMKLMLTESNLQTMRLKSLQSQLNPHFLFNTLHTITSLIGRNDDKAREITIKISGVLRKVLESNQLEEHTLSKELELVDDYLSIEQERFSDRLTVEIQIDKSASDAVVPTFILQPLIENAFKHGVNHVEGQTRLSVYIRVDKAHNTMNIEVINDVPKQAIANANSTGIGLLNLRERLEAYYRQSIVFSAATMDEHKYRVAFTIPFEP